MDDLKKLLENAGVSPLNEWQKDINTVSLLIDKLKAARAKHGNFRVLVSNDGRTINLSYSPGDNE